MQPNLILCLGTNYLQTYHIAKAQELLRVALPNIQFTSSTWSLPVGGGNALYMNCIAYGQTDLNLSQVEEIIHGIEDSLLRTRTKGSNARVTIDIDLLKLNDELFHLSDWEREYVKQLLVEIK